MIANISPSSKLYDDTHNTLKYASRAKEIKSSVRIKVIVLFYNCQLLHNWFDTWAMDVWMYCYSFTFQLKSNVVSLDSHIGQYAVICEKQKQEVIWNINTAMLHFLLILEVTLISGSMLTAISVL